MEAQTRGCQLSVSSVDQTLAVDVNPHLLVSAVGNLLQNAFKFTQPHSTVALNVYATTDRVRIDVTDQCGGLPQDFEATMFQPFTQGAPDKSGLGLGLSIARRIVESHQGILSVHNLPGLGCVFTIDLPRQAKPGTVIPV
jgi:signal transduction histidine kinase